MSSDSMNFQTFRFWIINTKTKKFNFEIKYHLGPIKYFSLEVKIDVKSEVIMYMYIGTRKKFTFIYIYYAQNLKYE